MLPSYIFILGLLIGSFLNVCIYRIPKGESVVLPPSHCTNCGNEIKWYDLVPVISYIFLRGKCRYCKEEISLRYPFIELITGVIFLALYIEYGLSFTFLKYIILVVFLIVIGMIDFDTTDVYFSTTISGSVTGAILVMVGFFYSHGSFSADIVPYILGAAVGGGTIAIIILITGGMGWGDAEICLLCGIFLGFKYTLVMLFLAFIIGAVIGIILVITKRKSRKDYIPFGPFIALAGIISILFGEKLFVWYMAIIFRQV